MTMYCGNLLRVGGDNNSIRFISCVTVCDVMGLWGLGETVTQFKVCEGGAGPGTGQSPRPDTAAAYINTNIAE